MEGLIVALIVIAALAIIIPLLSWNNMAVAPPISCTDFANAAGVFQRMHVGSTAAWTIPSGRVVIGCQYIMQNKSWSLTLPGQPFVNRFASPTQLIQAVVSAVPSGPNHADANVLMDLERGRFGYRCVRLLY